MRAFTTTAQAWLDAHPLAQAALSAAALTAAFSPLLILIAVAGGQPQ